MYGYRQDEQREMLIDCCPFLDSTIPHSAPAPPAAHRNLTHPAEVIDLVQREGDSETPKPNAGSFNNDADNQGGALGNHSALPGPPCGSAEISEEWAAAGVGKVGTEAGVGGDRSPARQSAATACGKDEEREGAAGGASVLVGSSRCDQDEGTENGERHVVAGSGCCSAVLSEEEEEEEEKGRSRLAVS